MQDIIGRGLHLQFRGGRWRRGWGRHLLFEIPKAGGQRQPPLRVSQITKLVRQPTYAGSQA